MKLIRVSVMGSDHCINPESISRFEVDSEGFTTLVFLDGSTLEIDGDGEDVHTAIQLANVGSMRVHRTVSGALVAIDHDQITAMVENGPKSTYIHTRSELAFEVAVPFFSLLNDADDPTPEAV